MKLWYGYAHLSYEDVVLRAESVEQAIEFLALKWPDDLYSVWEIRLDGEPGVIDFWLPSDASTADEPTAIKLSIEPRPCANDT